MKKYQEPKFDLIKLLDEDILTASLEKDNDGSDTNWADKPWNNV